jgi:16S rRNA U516 pseudouridylate synthase RsuA-like enzyme
VLWLDHSGKELSSCGYEGRKRQIRETCSLIGLQVVKIIRMRISSLLLGKLKPGEWRNLSASEVIQLKEISGVRPAKKQIQKSGDRKSKR